jgi:hypothetical protein
MIATLRLGALSASVTGQHNLPIGGLKLAWISQGRLQSPTYWTKTSREWKRKGRPHALNSAHGTERLACFALEGGTLLRGFSRAPAEQLECKKMMRIEARFDFLQFQKAAEHQAASDEQHKGKSHFCDHHDILKQPSAA